MMMSITRFWTYLMIAVLLSACLTQGQQTVIPPPNTVRDLMQQYRETRTLVLVYPGQADSTARVYKEWADSLKTKTDYLDIRIRIDEAVDDTEWKKFPLLLIGSPSSNKLLKKLIADLPLQFSDKGFEFGGYHFEKKDEVFNISVYPNPAAPEMPISVITSLSDTNITKHLIDNYTAHRRYGIPFGDWPWQVFRRGNKIALGAFDDDWKPDSSRTWKFDYTQNADFKSPNFHLFIHKAGEFPFNAQALAERMEKRASEISSFIDKPLELNPVSYHLYDSPEYMGLMTGEMEHNFIRDKDQSVHAIHHPQYENNFPEIENRLIIRQLLAKPSNPILEEGLAVYFADHWQNKGYAYWSAQIFRSGDALTIETLLDKEKLQYESPILRSAMAASLVDFLIGEWGKEIFLEKYTHWTPGTDDLRLLESKWKSYQKRFKDAYPNPDRRSKSLPYLKGMTFSHEGYQVYNGYGSNLAQASIKQLNAHYANAIAIVPYSGMRDPSKPTPFHMEHGARSENDASVVFSHYAAKSIGMSSLLKPQIWVRGHWPGDVEMKSDQAWEEFFDHYRRWIRHYALLAEIHQMDMLCIGVEFLKATIQKPQAWRKLIREMRQIYRGPIVYAANWGEEIEKLTFADELDFIGLNCYYPLSKKTDAGEKELKKGFRQTLDKIANISKRNNKEVIFTEIGFRSISQPWIQPHERAGENAYYSEQDQAICYEIVLEELQKQSWCRGIFWWKWPSFTGYFKEVPFSFTPNGKKAASILKQFYGNWPIIPSSN